MSAAILGRGGGERGGLVRELGTETIRGGGEEGGDRVLRVGGGTAEEPSRKRRGGRRGGWRGGVETETEEGEEDGEEE